MSDTISWGMLCNRPGYMAPAPALDLTTSLGGEQHTACECPALNVSIPLRLSLESSIHSPSALNKRMDGASGSSPWDSLRSLPFGLPKSAWAVGSADHGQGTATSTPQRRSTVLPGCAGAPLWWPYGMRGTMGEGGVSTFFCECLAECLTAR